MVIVTSLLLHNCSDLYGAFCLPFLPCTVLKVLPAVFGKGQIMNYNAIETGKRIQVLRKDKRLTQGELAEQLQISLRYLQKLESGERGGSIEALADISLFFQTSLDYIILGREQNQEMRSQLLEIADNLKNAAAKL